MKVGLIVDQAGLESSHGGDGLKGRARSKGLDAAIVHRPARIVANLVPHRTADAGGESIQIEGRPADHGEHLTGAGIKRHHRPHTVFKRQFGDRLQIEVETQLQALARLGWLVLVHRVSKRAQIVDHPLALAIDAHQNVVVFALDASLADDVALRVLGEFRLV